MFTAKIGSITKDKDKVSIFIYYYLDGVFSFHEEYSIGEQTTLEDIEKFAHNRIQSLTNRYAFVDTLVMGQELQKVVNTQELDKIDFRVKYIRLNTLNQAINLGIIDKSDQEYTDLVTELQTKKQFI